MNPPPFFDQAILFNGYSVGAGKNQMYAVPGSDAFEISINTLEIATLDNEQDVLKSHVSVELNALAE